MDITPIPRVNAVDQIFEQLKDLLIDGRWAVGDKLPSENELAEMFQVSRLTVRQALQKLKALDLIETRLGAGSYVKEINAADSFNDLIPIMYLGDITNEQILQFREMIDSESISIATEVAVAEDYERLEQIYSKMIDAQERNDPKDFSQYDLLFHKEIVKITKNPLFIKTYSILLEVLKVSLEEIIGKMRYRLALDYHKRMLEAMKTHDPDEAYKLMREYIEAAAKFQEDPS